MERKRISTRSAVISILFLLPAAVLMIFAVYVPFGWNAVLSFQEWNGFKDAVWVGFNNFVQIFNDPGALNAFTNSLFLAVFGTGISVALGVTLAAFVFKVTRKEGAFYRLIVFMPVMLPAAVVGLLFTFVFNPDVGLLNNFLIAVGLPDLTNAWLEDKNTVMWCIVAVNVWKMTGLSMMLSFASMQMLPESIFESSRIDGAGYTRQFFSMVLPLIKPTVLMAATYSLVINFKSYDIVFVMTRGGPGTLSQTVPINIMKTAFNFNEFGYSAAMGILLCVMVMLVVVIVRRILKGESYEY